MIICHRYRFIFLKTRKTAGSSVEIGLSRACGPGDVVTPLVEHLGEEDLRRREGGYGPCGDRKAWHEHRGFREWRRLLTRGERARRFEGLATADELRRLLGPEIWDSYAKVSVERNPWDRAVSRYWWNKYRWERKGDWTCPDLAEFLAHLEREKPQQMSNWDTYAIDGEVVADHMLFYESLSRDIETFRQKLGISEDISLPTTAAKSGFRSEKRHFSEVMTPEARAIVDRACRREIEHFGYRFGD